MYIHIFVEQAAELVAGLPEASVAWLASREAEALPDCSPVLTVKDVPKRTSETLARCYLLVLGLQQDRHPGTQRAGRRLHLLLPRMLLAPFTSSTDAKKYGELRTRAGRFLAGDFVGLIRDCPAALSGSQRRAMDEEAELRRGYTGGVPTGPWRLLGLMQRHHRRRRAPRCVLPRRLRPSCARPVVRCGGRPRAPP